MKHRFTRNARTEWKLILPLACVLGAAAQEREGPAPVGGAKSAYQLEMEKQWKLHPTLPIGSAAPDFNLPAIDGKKHTLADYKTSRVLAVMFICNHCPASQLYESRMKKMVDDYRGKGVQFLAIQPNAVSAISPRELNYTDVDDSLGSMLIHAKFRNFNFPYLYDGDTQQIAHLYGPKNTPHIFFFDQERKLRYEGRIDDSMRETAVKTQDARAAIDALLANRPVEFSQRPVFGCSIKWKSQTEAKQRELKQWEEQPVNLEVATADVLKKLRANPTGKTLMINFWAAWCGPCVEEFDDLLKTYLWYRSRDFELVTVSTDSPEAKATVLKFLQQHHSGVRNLQFESEDVYALQAAFDKSWDSGVPFTIVIGPDGKVIHQQTGEVNMLELRRAILANLPDMGYIGNAAYWARR